MLRQDPLCDGEARWSQRLISSASVIKKGAPTQHEMKKNSFPSPPFGQARHTNSQQYSLPEEAGVPEIIPRRKKGGCWRKFSPIQTIIGCDDINQPQSTPIKTGKDNSYTHTMLSEQSSTSRSAVKCASFFHALKYTIIIITKTLSILDHPDGIDNFS